MKEIAHPRRAGAFTLTELLVIIVIAAAVIALVPVAIIQAKKKVQRVNCYNQLRALGCAFRIWSGDNGDLFPMSVSITNGGAMEPASGGAVFPVFQVMSNEINTPKIPVCPADRRHFAPNFGSGFADTNLSYFVGLDANVELPRTPLIGDRNITGGRRLANGIELFTTNDAVNWSQAMHRSEGNFGVADGSVQTLSSAKLRAALANTGIATNRLAIP